MAFFVKHPPSDGLPPSDRRDHSLFTLGETPQQQAAIRAIEACDARFKETGNPIEAIDAFIYAHRARLFPPQWVLDFICQRFVKGGQGELDRAFGFTASGKGKRTPPAKRQRLDRRDHAWCVTFFKLEALGLTPSAAAAAISAVWQKQTHEELTPGAVGKAVKAAESRYSDERHLILADAKLWTIEKKRELLRSVGAVNLPRDIRKLYGL